MEVEDYSNIAFYGDRMILLTWGPSLREAAVGNTFETPDISIFEDVGEVEKVDPGPDTTLPHSTRVLYYRSACCVPYGYNMNTKENKQMKIKQGV